MEPRPAAPAAAKVILLGDSGAGKTALLRRCVDKAFDAATEGTIGVDYRRVDVRGVRLQVWDTAGEERFRSVTRMYLRGVDVGLVVFSLTNRSTARSVAYWAGLLREHSPGARVIVVGSQADASNQENEGWGYWDGGSNLVHFPSTDFPDYHAVSARTGKGVDELFEHVAHVCGAEPRRPEQDPFEVVTLPPFVEQTAERRAAGSSCC